MSTYYLAWIAARAENDRIILTLIGCGFMLAAAWIALGVVPERWRRLAEIAYLVSIGVLYAAVLAITGGK